MKKTEIIDSIELFLKADSEIEKWLELASIDSEREKKFEYNARHISLMKKIVEQKESDIVNSINNHRSIEGQNRRYIENKNELALEKALKPKVASKDAAIAEFNKLIRQISSSPFIVLLEQECNLGSIVAKLKNKKLKRYMSPEYMEDQFEIDKSYQALLLARIVSRPLLNYLNVPECLPDRATFNRAGKLSTELLELIEKHKELIPSAIGGNGPNIFKNVLSKIALDHLSPPKETEFVLVGKDNPRYQEPAKARVRPLESLKEIKYEEQRRLSVQLLFQDIGIRYINTFSLKNNTKGRPHAEIIFDLIPHACIDADKMPDIRTVQRWLKALDGFGTTLPTRSLLESRPYTRSNGIANNHRDSGVRYIRRFIKKPNLKD